MMDAIPFTEPPASHSGRPRMAPKAGPIPTMLGPESAVTFPTSARSLFGVVEYFFSKRRKATVDPGNPSLIVRQKSARRDGAHEEETRQSSQNTLSRPGLRGRYEAGRRCGWAGTG